MKVNVSWAHREWRDGDLNKLRFARKEEVGTDAGEAKKKKKKNHFELFPVGF